ncbi:N-formylglutamate amidohydrolase [Haliea sp. E17]|uniref:N-formylglutamate amidohydrolase n=1 Tax=Haliea sp. E17 TaxID=3401576 RepID=UPI003AADE0EB
MYPKPNLPITAHIPHAGTIIPATAQRQFTCSEAELWREMLAVTDWYADDLFALPGIAMTQTPISRVALDVERFEDDALEEKAAFGQGLIYTHSTQGVRLRRDLSAVERTLMVENYYRPWHLHLEAQLEQQVEQWGYSLLLDCHSFADKPFAFEDEGKRERPDFCLGTCANTPAWLLEHCRQFIEGLGYCVEVNYPYAGCLVPERFAGDTRVPAIMIEINRRLYIKDTAELDPRLQPLPVRKAGYGNWKQRIQRLMGELGALSASHLAPHYRHSAAG